MTIPSGSATKDLLTVQEVAHILRVDETTVRRWIHRGALKAVELPHRGRRRAFRIHRQTLDAILGTSTTHQRAHV